MRFKMVGFKFQLFFFHFLIHELCLASNFSDSHQSMKLIQIQKDIDKINSMQKLWTAGINYISLLSDEEMRGRMGSKIRPRKVPATRLDTFTKKKTKKEGISENFDARIKWSRCTVINNVKDQSKCGGCWAVATAAAFSDRKCIASKSMSNLEYSAEDLLTCCGPCKEGSVDGDGCLGGYTDSAFNFISHYGIVTGGDYGSANTCKPFSTAPCDSSSNQICPTAKSKKCLLECTNKNYKRSYKKDKKYGQMAYSLEHDEQVKQDIMSHGPLVASFIVCDDFKHYRKGIYFHILGPCDEIYHAVKIIGWGSVNDVPYWHVMNSWNSSWGDEGRFKIHMEHHNCDFGYFIASVP